jgi:hypothetical protein
MSEHELLEVRPPTPDEEALVALFAEMEKESLGTLDTGGRQVITLVTGLLGLFFGVLALKDAPTYLSYVEVQILGVLAVGLYFAALLLALAVVRPRRYEFSRRSLTDMRRQLESMRRIKSVNLDRAHLAFGLGSLAMALLLADVLAFRL